ncbi:ABC transporter permease [Amycolatopsis cihanbeyliensis]|uniref:ABC-2 type transport system permease protein n=1 Tax=Amycolatopsis cihanbeyliensis TaxID=1128664 RepID=A0A542DK72_AMYCI|nr:ABC transporter permease [Amycolatopsis cihanbeyliensis]TQJ03498.1 ABC-2 type transport system permease protein [Amycolatopsis cihanbeyliensis]
MNARIFRVEAADELRAILREPTALFFSILMPVAFFALFVSIFGNRPVGGDVPNGTRMVATFGTFAVLAVTMLNPGITVAQDREIGWLRAKRVSAVPVGLTLTAKLVAALPYAAGVLAVLAVTAALTGSLQASVGELLRIGGVLVLGSLPFALLSLAVGFRARANTAAAVLNAVLLPLAVLSGLWMPLEILPGFVEHLAPYLPTYHLAQLALSQLGAGAAAGHVLVLLATAVVAAGLAGLSYRHARL